jgi:hypothetical protein
VEQQLNQSSRLTLTWIRSRGVHLLNLRNTNAPIQGNYPAGDKSIRLLTESAGASDLNQLVAGANLNYKKLYLFGSYTLSYGMANNEGARRSVQFARGMGSNVLWRHTAPRGGASLPCREVRVTVFLLANSRQPYNITTGQDRLTTPDILRAPGWSRRGRCRVPDVESEVCRRLWVFRSESPGWNAHDRAQFRAWSGAWNHALRVSRTWTFGREDISGRASGGHGGGPSPDTGKKYSIAISASTLNALNHPNFATPNGDLSSPYFGQYRSLGGLIVMSHGGAPSTYNRKIDLQVRVTF